MFVQIKSFLQEHWKFCLSISLCIVFFAICLIIYMRTSEKSIEQLKTMKYEDTANTDKASHALHVDSGNARNITREIQYIHDGKTSPDVTYYVTAPTIEKAAEQTAEQIKAEDAILPPVAIEKTDRTVVTADQKKQKVDVYKINLRKDHRIKAGILQTDGKTYGGIGYQAGRWEGTVYTRDGRSIQAASVMYTVKQW